MLQWIKFKIGKLLGAKDENPYYIKLKKVLANQDKIASYNKVAFIRGFEYNEKDYLQFKQSVERGEPIESINTLKYNVAVDNVEVYYLEDSIAHKCFLLTLYDPVELYVSEEILDIMECGELDLIKIEHEVIYEEASQFVG